MKANAPPARISKLGSGTVGGELLAGGVEVSLPGVAHLLHALRARRPISIANKFRNRLPARGEHR